MFYDTLYFNHETHNVVDDFKYIATIYFRLATTEMNHSRIEYDYMALLEAMGGIGAVMFETATFFIGGFLSFNCSIEMMKELYSNNCDASFHKIELEFLSKSKKNKAVGKAIWKKLGLKIGVQSEEMKDNS